MAGALDFELTLANGMIEVEQILLLRGDDGRYILYPPATIDGPYAYLNSGPYLSSNPSMGQGGVALTLFESTD